MLGPALNLNLSLLFVPSSSISGIVVTFLSRSDSVLRSLQSFRSCLRSEHLLLDLIAAVRDSVKRMSGRSIQHLLDKFWH